MKAIELSSYRANKGISALPTILIVSAVIMEIAIVGVVLAAILNNTFLGERLAAEALGAARSGAQDAVVRVIRYKACPGTGCPASYSLTVGSRTADVTIATDGAGKITINSTGSAFTRRRKVEVILGVDSTTGEVKTQSFQEVGI